MDDGGKHDMDRMAQLEGELRRLIGAVDQRLANAQSDRPQPRPGLRNPTWNLPSTRWDYSQIMAAGGIAALLIVAGWAGSSLFYSMRLEAEIESEIRPYALELAATVTTIQTDLAPKLTVADELKAEIDRARRDLISRDEELDATITTAESQLLSIRDAAIDDIERRLTDQTDDLTLMLETARQRAMELDQGLQEVRQALAAFDHQLPILTDGFGEVAAKLIESRTLVDQVAQEASALDGAAPPLLESITTHRTDLEDGSKTLAVLQTQLEALKGQTARSSRQLEQMLSQGRGQMTNWQEMDRQVDNRKQEVMRTLDLYADSLNTHVRDFLEVLKGETVVTGG